VASAETADTPRPRALGLRGANLDTMAVVGVGLWLVIGLACTATWGLSGAEGRWPLWVWLGAGAPVAGGIALRAAWHVRPGPARFAAAHAGLAVVLSGVLAFVWTLSGTGGWLWWALLGIATAVSIHALLAFADRLPPRAREVALSERVDELQRTRRGALDVQAAERRRLERDIHDGAQSRLVALGMLLARAEDRMPPGSDAAALLEQARSELSAAVGELRALSQGLAPPLLLERGLVPAVKALTLRLPVNARVVADVPRRPPPEVEHAAYFVVAEALTNVLKHAPDARVLVALELDRGRLRVDVTDDGPGGADPDGSGLLGLRHSVEALDGRLSVGCEGGTHVRAELPCGS